MRIRNNHDVIKVSDLQQNRPDFTWIHLNKSNWSNRHNSATRA